MLLHRLCLLHVTDKDKKDKQEKMLVILHQHMAKKEFVLRLLRKVETEEDMTHPVTEKILRP